MFENMLKHTGQLNNTGKNVVVVFMQLPGDDGNALVIDTDALPDMYNEALRKVVESTEAQQSMNLSEVLARRMSPDGSNMTLLHKFHSAGRLLKTPVSNVTMVPRRGVRWPLTEVIAAMKSQQTVPNDFADLDPETRAEVAASVNKFNVHNNNLESDQVMETRGEAQSLLEMAALLEADALSKRERAYRLDPSLRPSAKKAAVESVSATQQTSAPAPSKSPRKSPKSSQ
jgi:hypothetical protein